MIQNKESFYLKYWDTINLFRWGISQKLSVNRFKWVDNTSQLNKHFMQNDNGHSDEGYFLEVDVRYSPNLHNFHSDLSLLPEGIKIEKVKTCS